MKVIIVSFIIIKGVVIDICTGTGDLAFELARVVGKEGKVFGLDFAQSMLDYAEKRKFDKIGNGNVNYEAI